MTVAILHDDVLLNIFRMDPFNILSIKEHVKWACVCRKWSTVNMKWIQEAHNEARLFSDSLMKRLYETNDLSAIVNSIRKYSWHAIYGTSCLSQIRTFLSSNIINDNVDETIKNDNEYSNGILDEVSVYDDDEENNNVYDKTSMNVGNINDHNCDMIENEVWNDDDYYEDESSIQEKIEMNISRKEQENKYLDIRNLFVLENIDSTIITYGYELKNLSYHQMDTNQKEAYFEAHVFDGINGSMNIMEQSPDHINRMSVTDLVQDCVSVIRDYRQGLGNITMCSFAVRLLKTMFQNVTSMRQISSGIVMEELLTMMKVATRTPDLISGLWLTMAICERNPTKTQEFFKNGGLELFMRVSKDSPKICIMFAICGFIFTICNVNFEDEGSPTVSTCVIQFFTQTAPQFDNNEMFMHSLCKTILCLSSDHSNRVALKQNGCIQVMKEIQAKHQTNQFILTNSARIIFRLNHTKI